KNSMIYYWVRYFAINLCNGYAFGGIPPTDFVPFCTHTHTHTHTHNRENI
ncbi:MAG: hypothetical protein ACI8RD_006070, partial [Bacillariaceae sp.]